MKHFAGVFLVVFLATSCAAQPVVERQMRTFLTGVAMFDSAARPSIKAFKPSPRISFKGLTGSTMDSLDIARMGATTGQGLLWGASGWAPGGVGKVDTAYNGLTKVPWPSRAIKWGGLLTENTTIDANNKLIDITNASSIRFFSNVIGGTPYIRQSFLYLSPLFGTEISCFDGYAGAMYYNQGRNTEDYDGAVQTITTSDELGNAKVFAVTGKDFYFRSIPPKTIGDQLAFMLWDSVTEKIRFQNRNSFLSGWAAGGDLNGSYPNPTVDALQGNAVSASAPSTNQVLKWNGSAWAPAADDSGTGTVTSVAAAGGAGISVSGSPITSSGTITITNTGDTDASNDITTSTTAGGDLNGTYPNPTVDGLQGNAVSASAPSTNQVLKWNGSAWAPAADTDTNSGGTVTSVAGTAGAGISISGSPITSSGTLTITNTGDTDASNDITTSTTAGGDLNGTYPNPTVDGLQGNAVSASAPSTNQVLKWNGSAWAPAADATGGSGTVTSVAATAGAGISISGSPITSSGTLTITNTGDTNASDDLTTSTSFSGDVTGVWNNLQIAANAVTTAEIAANTITGGDIASQTITAFNIANGAVGTNQLATGAVRTNTILDHDVQAVDLDTSVIYSYHIADYEIGSDKLTTTGVTPGTYGSTLDNAIITVDYAGRITNASQTAWASGVYVVASGVTYRQLNENDKVARVSGAGGNLVVGLDANLHELVTYYLICDQNDSNSITFQCPSGSAFKFADVLGGSLTTFVAGEAAHYTLIRDGSTYIISN